MSVEERENVIRYYEETATAYEKWGGNGSSTNPAIHFGYHPDPNHPVSHTESLRHLTQKLISLAGVKPDDIVLDAGCGYGNVSAQLSKIGAATFAVNISRLQLRVAANNPDDIYFSEQDYTRLGFPPETFSRVLFCESLAHAQTKSLVISEARRVLGRDGSIVVADYFLKNSFYNRELLDQFESGWAINVVSLEDIRDTFHALGLTFFSQDITANILPSLALAAQSASEHSSDEIVSVGRQAHRTATIAFHRLARADQVGYFLLKGQKK